MVAVEYRTVDDADALASLVGAPGWQRDAACVEHPELADAFFPERGELRWKDAREVCRGCLVQRDCLAFALDEDVHDGIWGGSTVKDRAALVKAGVTGELVRRFGSRVTEGREVLLDKASMARFGFLLDLDD